MPIQLEPQQNSPLTNDEVLAALEEARAEVARGEVVTLEQSNINLRNWVQALRTTQESVPTA